MIIGTMNSDMAMRDQRPSPEISIAITTPSTSSSATDITANTSVFQALVASIGSVTMRA